MKTYKILFIFPIIHFILFSFLQSTPKDIWPTNQWNISTPEQQGIDSNKLIEFIETIKKQNRHLHSLVIIRRGQLVTEAYFSPYQREDKHIIFSATKSISTLLIGIAVKEGLIKDINQPLIEFFPEYKGKILNLDKRKKKLTLKDLLTMRDGLDWTDGPYRVGIEGDFLKLLSAEDGVKYYLDKPMKNNPGTVFNYNSGSSYMLSAIIQKCTGKSALEYAREKLFEPMGIIDSCWGTFQKGINNGGSELFLRPLDMAKIGYLILKKGNWKGVQIIPTQWIEDSTKTYVKTDFLNYTYGYMWYIDQSLPYRSISAQGLGGQYIYIIPDLEMVVVFTGGMVVNRDEEDIQYYFLRDFILPAVKSSNPLADNPQATSTLNRLIAEAQNPEPNPVPELPSRVKRINRKTYHFNSSDIKNNPFSIETVTVNFERANQCRVKFTFPQNPPYISMGFDGMYRTNPYSKRASQLEIKVGLDNIYHRTMIKTEIETLPYFAKGEWLNTKTFMVNSKSGWSLPEKIEFTFTNPETLSITWSSIFYKFSLSSQKEQ